MPFGTRRRGLRYALVERDTDLLYSHGRHGSTAFLPKVNRSQERADAEQRIARSSWFAADESTAIVQIRRPSLRLRSL